MSVIKVSDLNKPVADRIAAILAQLLDPNISDVNKKSLMDALESFLHGEKIGDRWYEKYGIRGETGIENNMGYIDLYVPEKYIPLWFIKENPGKDAKVRFYLTVLDKGGIGPVKEKTEENYTASDRSGV